MYMPWRYKGIKSTALLSLQPCALDRGESSASHSGPFTPKKESCYSLK
jgi:hypothetical protein